MKFFVEEENGGGELGGSNDDSYLKEIEFGVKVESVAGQASDSLRRVDK